MTLFPDLAHQQYPGLGNRLDHQHAGHHRETGKVAGEIELLRLDIPVSLNQVGFKLGDRINEQEWFTMGQHLFDLLQGYHDFTHQASSSLSISRAKAMFRRCPGM